VGREKIAPATCTAGNHQIAKQKKQTTTGDGGGRYAHKLELPALRFDSRREGTTLA
jgi:hypothetical protein